MYGVLPLIFCFLLFACCLSEATDLVQLLRSQSIFHLALAGGAVVLSVSASEMRRNHRWFQRKHRHDIGILQKKNRKTSNHYCYHVYFLKTIGFKHQCVNTNHSIHVMFIKKCKASNYWGVDFCITFLNNCFKHTTNIVILSHERSASERRYFLRRL